MPARGIPRCECGHARWSYVSQNRSGVLVQCRNCLAVKRSQSKEARGIAWKAREERERLADQFYGH